jgi:hypothetical protein
MVEALSILRCPSFCLKKTESTQTEEKKTLCVLISAKGAYSADSVPRRRLHLLNADTNGQE